MDETLHDTVMDYSPSQSIINTKLTSALPPNNYIPASQPALRSAQTIHDPSSCSAPALSDNDDVFGDISHIKGKK